MYPAALAGFHAMHKVVLWGADFPDGFPALDWMVLQHGRLASCSRDSNLRDLDLVLAFSVSYD